MTVEGTADSAVAEGLGTRIARWLLEPEVVVGVGVAAGGAAVELAPQPMIQIMVQRRRGLQRGRRCSVTFIPDPPVGLLRPYF